MKLGFIPRLYSWAYAACILTETSCYAVYGAASDIEHLRQDIWRRYAFWAGN